MPFNFRPSLIPTLAAAAAIAATVSLGEWQSGRAAEKQVLQDQWRARQDLPPVDPATLSALPDDWSFRRAVVEGEFLAERLMFLDNKSQGTRVGVHVIVPFRLKGSRQLLLVNLGWMARPAGYPSMPRLDLPSGPRRLEGRLVPPIRRFLELGPQTVQGALWQNLTPDRARQALGDPVLDLILQARPAGQGLEAVTELPDAGIDKHRGYAFQWYSLALLVALLWLGLNLRKARSP